MLQAELKNGRRITLAELPRTEVEKYRKDNLFYCPTCKGQVIAKVGSKVIPHFAHQSNVSCPSFKGGEGIYHERGKLLLYQWLKSQHLDTELERYLPDIEQRPDILVTFQKKKIALEFQCARISIKEIQKRNKGYRQAKITPIWILGANQFKRQGAYELKIDAFTKQFIHQFSSNHLPTLFYFCPDLLQFTIFQDIYPISLNRAIGQFDFKKLTEMNIMDLFHTHSLSKEQLYSLWGKVKKNFRLQYRNHLYGKELTWHQWLYLRQTHFEHLPAIIHLPVQSQFKMRSSPWDWQSRLCLDIIAPLKLGEPFTTFTCKRYFKNDLHHSHYYPLIQSTQHPITEYLQLLAHLGVIKQHSTSHYIKSAEIKSYQHVEQSLQADETILKRLTF